MKLDPQRDSRDNSLTLTLGGRKGQVGLVKNGET